MARALQVHVVDPSAFTPPYDHALCAALARAGADVTLVTSRFPYGEVPPSDGYALDQRFYRLAPGGPGSRARLVAKLAQHAPDMLRYRAAAREADVVHFQWLPVQHADALLAPRPHVLTAHDVLPREPRPGQRRAQQRLYERAAAVVVHSEHGRDRLTGELGIDPARVEVIHHGAFAHLATIPRQRPAELPEHDRPVVLLPGLLRPYKGLDVLYAAWRDLGDAELWVVGMPRMALPAAPPNVRVVPRFVSDAELAWCLARADVVALPYREADQSGALFAALAFGKAMVLSRVGGFPEVGAGVLVEPGDPQQLHETLRVLLCDDGARSRAAAQAAEAAMTRYSWAAAASAHLRLYASIRER